jgi:hypothetical protein
MISLLRKSQVYTSEPGAVATGEKLNCSDGNGS